MALRLFERVHNARVGQGRQSFDENWTKISGAPVLSTPIGRVGSDPEYRKTGTGKDFAFFPLYVNERFGDSERVTRYKVKTWNELGRLVRDHLEKGQQVFVSGTPSVEAWRGKEGKPRAQLVVTAQTFRFLGDRPPAELEVDEGDD